MSHSETEIQIMIEPMCLIHSVSRGIIRGKLMNLRKTFKIPYQKQRTAVGNIRRARFEESPLVHSKKIKERIKDCSSLETKFTIKRWENV